MVESGFVASFIVLVIGCLSANMVTYRLEAVPYQSEGNMALEPDVSKSFATIGETATVIGILGNGWALRMTLPSPNATLKRGKYPVDAHLVRGPDLEKYIRPSAGPATPPLPVDDRYAVLSANGLEVFIHDEVRAYGGAVIITLSAFEAGESGFSSLGPVRLLVRGPYP